MPTDRAGLPTVNILTEPHRTEHVMDACLIEDASLPGQDFPCLWDAAHQGNGLGTSFVLDEPGGVPHYVTATSPDGSIVTDDVVAHVIDAVPSTEVTVTAPVTLAHTGIDPLGAIVATLLVTVGAALVTVKRLAR